MQNKTPTDAAAASSAVPGAAPSSSSAPGGAVPDGFQRVDAAPEMQSGEALLVEAYAFIWVVLFGLVLFTWLRQRGLDARMNELEASIARARDPRPSPKKSEPAPAAAPTKKAGADEGD